MTGLFGAAPEPMSLWAMLGGGLLAFVSPCVLPMLPVYAMYLLGGTDAAPGRLRVLRRCGRCSRTPTAARWTSSPVC